MQYVKHKESLYEEAEIEMTPQKIMDLAITKFNTLKEQDVRDLDNVANEEIIALKAEIALLKQNNKRKPDQNKKGDERNSWNEKTLTGKEVLVKNNKTYHWCPYHRAYIIHKPDECKLSTKKQKTDNGAEELPVAGMTAGYNEEAAFNTFGDEVVDE